MKMNKKILTVVTILIIIALSAAVVFLAIRLTECDDRRTDAEKYYDNKCQSYATQNVNSAKGQIVFVGDSITDLYVLDEHYADLPIACYNRGIGGDTTAGVLRRLDVSIFDIEPSVVVLMIGTNDINAGLDEDGIFERYTQIVKSIRHRLPDAKLYCMSIIPQNGQIEEHSSIDLDVTTAKILSINPKICQIAQENGAIYLDVFSLLADNENHLIKEYSDDGLHLNNNGLKVWTKLLKPYLFAY